MGKTLRDQKGAVLPLTIVIMVVGAISVAALFGYLGASLLLAGKSQENVDAYYAADSGIEYGLARLLDYRDEVEVSGSKQLEAYELNGKSVEVVIEAQGHSTYSITSTAFGDDVEETAVAYVQVHDYAYMLEDAIVSDGDVQIQPNCAVRGNVTYVGSLCGEERIEGTITHLPDGIKPWPTADTLSAFYWGGVKGLQPYESSTISIPEVTDIGPLYRDGSLSIVGTSKGAEAQLQGSIYVSEQLEIGQSGKKDITLDLNNQTIYCDYRGQGDAIRIGPKFTLTGRGCIVAVGDIQFQPKLQSNPNDYILVISIAGEVSMQPQGDYYGTLAGDTDVRLQPACTVTRDSSLPLGLNFPYNEFAVQELLAYNID